MKIHFLPQCFYGLSQSKTRKNPFISFKRLVGPWKFYPIRKPVNDARLKEFLSRPSLKERKLLVVLLPLTSSRQDQSNGSFLIVGVLLQQQQQQQQQQRGAAAFLLAAFAAVLSCAPTGARRKTKILGLPDLFRIRRKEEEGHHLLRHFDHSSG